MARPRAFDTDQAIVDATAVFWDHGYQDASLPELLEGMGLTRGSLYKAFKDKKNLFLMVLDHYEQAAVDAGVSRLADPAEPDGRIRIATLFRGIVHAVKNGDHRGCLLCTAATGPEMTDPEIAQAVHHGLSKMQKGFLHALGASPAHQGIAQADLLTLANVLLTQYIGLRVLARSRLPLGVLEDSADGVAHILR